MTVELIEAPVVLNLESKPDVRTQLGNVDTPGKNNASHRQPNEVSASVAEAESEETDTDYFQSELPEAAKARFGKGGINAIQFSPDGTQLAVGTDIGVWLYDMETGEKQFLFEGMCQSLAFSPDGRFLANGGGKFRGQEIQLWEIAADRKVPLTGGPFVGSVLQFSEDSKTLISLGNQGDTIGWLDVETGHGYVKEAEAQFGMGTPYPEVFALTYDKIAIGWDELNISLVDRAANLHSMPRVTALAFSPDGTTLAGGTKQGGIQTWSVATGKAVAVFAKPTGQEEFEDILALCFSSDGTLLAAGSYSLIRIWEVDTGNILLSVNPDEGQRGNTWTYNIHPESLVFSPDNTILISGLVGGAIRLWEVTTGDRIAALDGHTQQVETLAFSSDGKTLVSTGADGTILLWNWNEVLTGASKSE